ncbi:hypothetical protein PE36_18104 [Moritella sp. PE36]|uniref:WD40/YVTN/BNR-like repeat-containing protein n=1 Tax=Moritella sp. PE36 TaxID=58051 RepID=UPI00015693F2|nr:hypothetical protein [Moritella sp. PE36]EDM65560.1 hypothetical protein PE36_18104 [Moritella sp. PE36]
MLVSKGIVTKLMITSVLATIGIFYYNQTPYCGIVFDSARRDILKTLSLDTVEQLLDKRSLTFPALCQMPISKLKRSLTKLAMPKPDNPGEAKAFRHLQRLSQDNEINIGQLQKVQAQMRNFRRQNYADAGINAMSWQALGPGNVGGRIRSITFDPDNSAHIYVGSVSGGIWSSQNSGNNWQPLDDFMANLSVSSLIFDANDHNVMYAGTGEGIFNMDQIRGLGIFKSNNKGQTWSSVLSTQNNTDFYWVNRLTSRRNNSAVIAATHTGIFTSNDGGLNWNNSYLGRSNDVDVNPDDDNKLIAGTWGGLLYSQDGGLNWSLAQGLSHINNVRIETAYAYSNANIVFASVDYNSGELWKSTDGGQSYQLINTGLSYLGVQGWYDNALWVDPLNENHIIVGGIDLWRSIDGGISFNKISTWWQAPRSAHADHHFIIHHPDYDGVNNQRLFFANDGGIYETPDISLAKGSTGWKELNNNLSITQFYSVAVSHHGKLIGGTQDNGTLVYTGDSENWTDTYGGDGGFSAADPVDDNYLYGEYVYLRLHRSSNGGISSESIYTNDMINDSPNFIAPFILDPNNPDRMLAGSRQLWLSADIKAVTPTWRSIKPITANQSPISAIAIPTSDSNIIYIGHNDGSIFKTNNAMAEQPEWNNISGANLPQRYLTRITVNPVNKNILFVSFGGYEDDNLWQSTDGGISWNNSTGLESGSLPPAPIRAIAIHPIEHNHIYIGNEVGIFTSHDNGDSWSLEHHGPANVSIDELTWGDNSMLYAATHGRGVFSANTNLTIPNAFYFPDKLDVALNSIIESEEKVIRGLAENTPITIVNGEYSKNCTGGYTNTNGYINNGDTLCLKHTSANEYGVKVITELKLGTLLFTFQSQTVINNASDVSANKNGGSLGIISLILFTITLVLKTKNPVN